MEGIAGIEPRELERRRERVRRAWAYRRVDHLPLGFILEDYQPLHRAGAVPERPEAAGGEHRLASTGCCASCRTTTCPPRASGPGT